MTTAKELRASLKAANIDIPKGSKKADLEALIAEAGIEVQPAVTKIRNGKSLQEKETARLAEEAEEAAKRNKLLAEEAAAADKAAADKAAEDAAKARAKLKTRHDHSVKVEVLVTMADGKKHKDVFTLINPRGCMPIGQICDPKAITVPVREKIGGLYGANNIR